MTFRTVRIDLSDVTFTGPQGELVQTAATLKLRFSGDLLERVLLILDLSYDQWAVVDKLCWFHLEPEARGKTFGGQLSPDKDVRIEALLHPGSVTLLSALAESAQEMANLFRKPEYAEIQSTGRWWAQSVTQEEFPGLRGGFATRWVNADLSVLPPG